MNLEKNHIKLKGKDLYPLVYFIIKRAQKENQSLQYFINYFEWSKRIPLPENTSDELANALCTSISSSQGVGLEIYFQEKVFLNDISNTSLLIKLKYLFIDNLSNDENYILLGNLIREIFDGRLIPNELDNELLKNI
jgi:hypothetical protein